MTLLADFQIRKLCEINKPMITSFIDKQVKTDGNGLIRILGLATERTCAVRHLVETETLVDGIWYI